MVESERSSAHTDDKDLEAEHISDSTPERIEEDHEDGVIGQEKTAASQVPSYVPPNGGYGWVCVGAVFFINAHTWGLNSVRVSPFTNPTL
jgi:hypothetical protein